MERVATYDEIMSAELWAKWTKQAELFYQVNFIDNGIDLIEFTYATNEVFYDEILLSA